MATTTNAKKHFHVGIVVRDFKGALDELGRALGVGWGEPHTSVYGPWEIEVVYSLDGPPFLEVIRGVEGSPWDTTAGSHLHHLGFWSTDVVAESAGLEASGIPVEFDPAIVGRGGRFCYHLAEVSGVRLELRDDSNRAVLELHAR